MNILALDLGRRCGWCLGPPGPVPPSGAWTLKHEAEIPAVAYSTLTARLEEILADSAAPALVVKEAPLQLRGFGKLGTSAQSVRVTHALHGIVEMLCYRYQIACTEVAPSTVRKHFLGAANAGDRAATKRATVSRCHVLGYFPRNCNDDDRGDACAIWDFACANYGKRRGPAQVLHLFNERPFS